MRTRPFQHLLGATVSKCRFWPPRGNQALQQCLRSRPAQALLPTLAGKTLVCHCRAHEECHVDALAQAYECEVMSHSEAFTSATLQQNDTSFVTEPHGYSLSADGGGVHSSGDWLAPQTGISDIFNDFRHAIVEIVSKHGLHNAARAAWAVRSRSLFTQDKHSDDILVATSSFPQSAGFHPNLSVHPNQPFRLWLIRHLLQLMQDPDIGHIDTAESGFHTGVFEPIWFSGIWRRQQIEAREDGPLKIYDTNWKSAEEDPDTVSRLIQEDIDAKFVQVFHSDIAQDKKRWP